MAQVEDCLPSMGNLLGSSPRITNTKKSIQLKETIISITTLHYKKKVLCIENIFIFFNIFESKISQYAKIKRKI
jgi:hypothetical protein